PVVDSAGPLFIAGGFILAQAPGAARRTAIVARGLIRGCGMTVSKGIAHATPGRSGLARSRLRRSGRMPAGTGKFPLGTAGVRRLAQLSLHPRLFERALEEYRELLLLERL